MKISPGESPNLADAAFLSGNLGADIRYRAFYELTDTQMVIKDPVWGDETLGGPEQPYDAILVTLAHHDALRRLQTIEQLTLPERYSTIPDSYYFSRWEHVWGSLILVRRMTQETGLDPKSAMYLQLKALLADFKHTAFSHAGDWLFEGGEGGVERSHEDRADYAATVGINRLLEVHGFDAQRVFDDNQEDITDMHKPSIDADNIDYTLREAYRWVDQSPVLKQHLNSESFTVRDGHIVMKSRMGARMLGMVHALLVTEYWHDPVERLQLNLLLQSLKRVFIKSNGLPTEWASYSPRDLMTTADHTLIEKLREHDEFVHVLDGIMFSVANSERDIHWRSRRDYVRDALDKTAERQTSTIDWVKGFYDKLPPSCEIELSSKSNTRANDRIVTIPLPAHRERYLNPHFVDEKGDVTTLKEAEPEFWSTLQDMFKPTRQNWRASLIHNRTITKLIRDCIQTNQKAWPEVMARPPLSSDAVRALLRETVTTSINYGDRFINFSRRR